MRSNISIGGSGNCALPGAEQLAAPAGQQILVIVVRAPLAHCRSGAVGPVPDRKFPNTATVIPERRTGLWNHRSISRKKPCRAGCCAPVTASPIIQTNMTDPIANVMPRRPVFEDDDAELPVERLQTLPAAGRRTGCPFHDVRQMLREVGLRPTRQRVALGRLLFAKGDRHVTAEMLHEEALRARVPVSLATVYNTLHQFTEARLLREVAVDGVEDLFRHQHVRPPPLLRRRRQSICFDIPGAELLVERLPKPPAGIEVARVDVVVRLRRKG